MRIASDFAGILAVRFRAGAGAGRNAPADGLICFGAGVELAFLPGAFHVEHQTATSRSVRLWLALCGRMAVGVAFDSITAGWFPPQASRMSAFRPATAPSRNQTSRGIGQNRAA